MRLDRRELLRLSAGALALGATGARSAAGGLARGDGWVAPLRAGRSLHETGAMDIGAGAYKEYDGLFVPSEGGITRLETTTITYRGGVANTTVRGDDGAEAWVHEPPREGHPAGVLRRLPPAAAACAWWTRVPAFCREPWWDIELAKRAGWAQVEIEQGIVFRAAHKPSARVRTRVVAEPDRLPYGRGPGIGGVDRYYECSLDAPLGYSWEVHCMDPVGTTTEERLVTSAGGMPLGVSRRPVGPRIGVDLRPEDVEDLRRAVLLSPWEPAGEIAVDDATRARRLASLRTAQHEVADLLPLGPDDLMARVPKDVLDLPFYQRPWSLPLALAEPESGPEIAARLALFVALDDAELESIAERGATVLSPSPNLSPVRRRLLAQITRDQRLVDGSLADDLWVAAIAVASNGLEFHLMAPDLASERLCIHVLADLSGADA